MSSDDRINDTTNPARADLPGTHHYEIRVKGHLGTRWSAWFDDLSLTTQADGTTVMCGPVADQAALHGLLQKLRDIGIPLVALTQVSPEASTTNERH